MLYTTELYYFFDQKDFPFEKALLTAVKSVGENCVYYKAKLLSPKKGVKEIKREGKFPENSEEKQRCIEELINWIFENSECLELFSLFMDSEEIDFKKSQGKNLKFDHHDDTCCWIMGLDDKEFDNLRKSLIKENLPEDLFYESGKEIMVPQPLGPVSRFFGYFGITSENNKIYTPKRWEAENKNIN